MKTINFKPDENVNTSLDVFLDNKKSDIQIEIQYFDKDIEEANKITDFIKLAPELLEASQLLIMELDRLNNSVKHWAEIKLLRELIEKATES